MDKDALKAALHGLMQKGSLATDNKLSRLAAAKKAPPAAAPEMCPECKVPLEEGKCAQCGYELEAAPEDEGGGDLAALLESGAQEG